MLNLGKDEEIIALCRLHWGYVAGPLIWATFMVSKFRYYTYAAHSSYFSIFDLFIVIITFVPLSNALIKIWSTELILTNKRIYGKVGFINTKTLDTPLNKVNNISISSGLFGKIFGYGKISITSSSGNYRYQAISDPEFFRDIVMTTIIEK